MKHLLDIITPGQALVKNPWFIPGIVILVVAVVAVAIIVGKKNRKK